jgi:flagellar motor switch protein FliM
MTVADRAPLSLIKKVEDTAGFGQIDRVGHLLLGGIQELLSTASGHSLTIKPGSVNVASYTEWRIAQNPHGLLLRYRITAQNGQMLVHFPGVMVSQIVDLAYGGQGHVTLRTHFTPAEHRFVKRIAEQLVPFIHAAWGGAPPVMPSLANVELDLLNSHWPKAHDRIYLQSALVEGDRVKPATISWMISADTAKAIPSESNGDAESLDPVWRDRMKAAAMAVRMPVRSVLTRCELPVTRLLHLAVGDVIPIFLPSTVPLTVAGRIFAHASLGEASGRAALCIETIEKGI